MSLQPLTTMKAGSTKKGTCDETRNPKSVHLRLRNLPSPVCLHGCRRGQANVRDPKPRLHKAPRNGLTASNIGASMNINYNG